MGQAEGVADGHDPVTYGEAVRTSHGERRQSLLLDLDDGDVGLRVGADEGGLELPTVRHLHRDAVGPADDVVVGEDVAVGTDDESREVLRHTYALLDLLPADQRIAFTLRFFEGMELTEIAGACGVSLATVKRKLARAEHRFLLLASKQPALQERIERSERWRNR